MHLALNGLEEALRFIRERVFLVPRKIPAPVMLEPEIIRHHGKKKQERDLNHDVHADANAMDFLRRGGGRFVSGHVYSLHFLDWNAW
jgi:hypothetical protein